VKALGISPDRGMIQNFVMPGLDLVKPGNDDNRRE
jgi:hypothetical protein